MQTFAAEKQDQSISWLDIVKGNQMRILLCFGSLLGHIGVMVNVVGRINEVNQRRARLVLGWVTIFRWLNYLGM